MRVWDWTAYRIVLLSIIQCSQVHLSRINPCAKRSFFCVFQPNVCIVTFHTHARFGHNAEIKKTFFHKKLVENVKLWIGYFLFYFVWICFPKYFYFLALHGIICNFFENSQVLAVFCSVIFTNPPSYPHLSFLDKCIILL